MTEILTSFEDNQAPDMQVMVPINEEVIDGFVTRDQANLLYMPPVWNLPACDRTVRGYLNQFGIQAVSSGFFTKLDLLSLASRYEAWLDEDVETRREHWLTPKPDNA